MASYQQAKARLQVTQQFIVCKKLHKRVCIHDRILCDLGVNLAPKIQGSFIVTAT